MLEYLMYRDYKTYESGDSFSLKRYSGREDVDEDTEVSDIINVKIDDRL